MRTYTITEEDIRSFHNSRCSLLNALEEAKEILKENSSIIRNLKESMRLLDKSFTRLRKESDDAWERMNEHFNNAKEKYSLKSEFSIYDIDSLAEVAVDSRTKEKLPTHFALSSFYSNKEVEYAASVPPTYLELWKLANILVEDANDTHIFVEGFYKVSDNEVEVILGS